jgi:site-specific DNA recombinase
MKAALYARYSSDMQRNESITAQIRDCQEYCRRKRYSVVKEYIDEAFTARNDDRPAFQQMISDAKAGVFNVIVFHKIDRNSRDRYDYFHYKRVLAKAGVTIEYVEQNIDGSPESIILESVLVGMSEYYSKNLAREVMKGLKENAHKAKFNGGIPPLGYRIEEGKYVIDEREAEAIRIIFAMYVAGHGYPSIAGALNDKYVTRAGKPFGKNSLHEILKNEKYAGTYTFNKVKRKPDRTRNSHSKSDELIVVENAIPAIIGREAFEQVREKMLKNKNRSGAYKATEPYLLSGAVYCECGAAMVGKTTTVREGKYHYYYCGDRERVATECQNPMIRRDKLENHVFDRIDDKLLNPAKLPQLIAEINESIGSVARDVEQDKKIAQKQKNEALRKLDNLYKLVEDGAMDEFTRERMQKQREEVERINSYILEVENKAKRELLSSEQIGEIMIDYQNAIKEKDPDRLRAILNTFIDKITVTRKEVHISLQVPFCRFVGAEGANKSKPTTTITINCVENREVFKRVKN